MLAVIAGSIKRKSHVQIYAARGRALAHMCQLEQALSDFEQAATLSSRHGPGRYLAMQGMCCHALGNWSDAIKCDLTPSTARDTKQN